MQKELHVRTNWQAHIATIFPNYHQINPCQKKKKTFPRSASTNCLVNVCSDKIRILHRAGGNNFPAFYVSKAEPILSKKNFEHLILSF